MKRKIPAWLARILEADNRVATKQRRALELALPTWVARCTPSGHDQLLSNIVERIGYSPN